MTDHEANCPRCGEPKMDLHREDCDWLAHLTADQLFAVALDGMRTDDERRDAVGELARRAEGASDSRA